MISNISNTVDSKIESISFIIREDFGKEIEKQLSVLSSAGDKFDMSSLFFQVCLVFGALSLVLKNEKTQKFFFQSMIGLGALGTGLSIWNLVSILQSLG